MKLICIRIMSVLAVAGIGAGSLIAPSSMGVAAAASQPFEGMFASNKARLQLRYDVSSAHFVGSFALGNDLFPVEGTVTGSSFAGQYVRNTRSVPLKATLAGDIVNIVYNGGRDTLRRVDPASDVGIPLPSPKPSNESNRSAVPIFPPTADAGRPLTPTPKPVTKAVGNVAPVAQPGMRLTFFLGSRTTGTGAVPVNPNDVPATASAGYVQVNVLDVSNDEATIEVRQYLPDTSLNSVHLVISTTSVVPMESAVDGYWRSPAALAGIKDQPTGDETVVRLNYPLDGKTYSAIRITTKAGTSTTQSTYDLVSGVLLSQGFNGTGANGSTQVVQTLFKGARQIRLPWDGQRPSPAVTGLKRLSFAGQNISTVDNSFTSTSPLTQDWEILKVGVASVQVALTTGITIGNNSPNQSKANVSIPLSGLWIAPKILGTLRTGQMLDDDPITHAKIKVFGIQNGTIAIGEQNEIQSGAAAYDLKTGLAVAFQTQLRTALGSTTVYLQRTS